MIDKIEAVKILTINHDEDNCEPSYALPLWPICPFGTIGDQRGTGIPDRQLYQFSH